MRFRILAWIALVSLLSACSSAPPARDDVSALATPLRSSIVFVIHGDSDYRYHDSAGRALEADEVVLERARSVAERNPHAQVFIFHQKARRRLLLLFPRRDGSAYVYRHGRLVEETSYWRDQGASRFAPEVAIYEKWNAAAPHGTVRMLFYFGHELPEAGGRGYDASYASRSTTVDHLADAAVAFAADSEKLDLVALGTCFGGTPYTIGAFAPHARTILASPGNLHLSYFDLEPLAALDLSSEDGAVERFADDFARHAFDRLAREVQTPVTIAVYDAAAVTPFTSAVAGEYARALGAVADASPADVERCDCAADSIYVRPEMSVGVTVYDRPPRFGRDKNRGPHSGWECPRVLQ